VSAMVAIKRSRICAVMAFLGATAALSPALPCRTRKFAAAAYGIAQAGASAIACV